MINIEIDVSGAFDEVAQEMNRKTDLLLEALGQIVEGNAKQNITEAERVDTGRMRNSVAHYVDTDEKSVTIGTPVKYAVYHELGTGIYVQGGRQTPWAYRDSNGVLHWTRGIKGIHFMRRALTEHLGQLAEFSEKFLKNS